MSDRAAREAAHEEVGEQGVEQKETEETKGEEIEQKDESAKEEAAESDASVPGDARNATEGVPSSALLAERIGQSQLLPPGLRTRLAAVAGSGGGVEEVVRVVEEALLEVMRLDQRDIGRSQHPAGDLFFHGDAEALADEQAEAIARGQLARSGMLRGQRVAVAD